MLIDVNLALYKLRTGMVKQLKIDISNFNEMEFSEIIKQTVADIFHILHIIKAEKLPNEIKQSIKTYLVVRLVSILEHYCRNQTREAIDTYKISANGLFDKNEVIIKTSDLAEIMKDNEKSFGKIISYNINFQDWGKIKKTFNILLGDNFTEKLVEMAKKAPVTYEGKKQLFNLDNLHELLNLRHDIVHRLYHADISDEQLTTYYLTVLMFIMSSKTILQTRFEMMR